MIHDFCHSLAGRPASIRRWVLAIAAVSFVPLSAARDESGRNPARTISVRNAHAMTYDRHRGRVVLFGGADASTVRGDTWEWDGAGWAQISLAGPEPRTFAAMAYDSLRQRTVLFGGNRVLFGGDPAASNTFLGDTWEWDGLKWTPIRASGPPPRAEAAIAFDEKRNRIVLFGGYNRAGGKIRRLGDTWEWDGATWMQVPAPGPSPRNGAAQVYDRLRGTIVLVGGRAERGTSAETWEWNGARWTHSLAASRQGIFNCSLAYDSDRHRIVRFGGYSGKQRVAETWEFDGASWSLTSSTGPAARNHAAMAYDERRKRVVLYGGHDGLAVFGDTWDWDGKRWQQRAASDPETHVDNDH